MQRVLFAGLLLFVAVMHSQAAQTEQSLTLQQALVRVLQDNPVLQRAPLESQAMLARVRAAELTPPMRLQLALENFAGSDAYQGSDALDTTLSLAKIFELGDKGARRAEVAQQAAGVFNSEQDALRLDILAQAAKRFIHVVADQERLRIAQDKLELLQRSLEVVNRRVKAGRSHVAERRRMAIDVARARLELEHAEHELQSARVRLATQWGDTTAQFSQARAELFAVYAPQAFAQLAQHLERNPDLARFASARRLAEARAQLAESRRRADIELSAGMRHFSATDDNAFVLSATLPLGLDARAAPYIDEEQLRAQALPFDLQQRRLELYSTLYGVYQEIVHSHEATRLFTSEIIPQAQQALAEYEQGYEAGRFSFLELSDAQQALLQARLDALGAAANFHKFKIEIDRLTGAGLPAGDQP